MKQLNNFIQEKLNKTKSSLILEKLKINSKSKILKLKQGVVKSIEDLEDGDIITYYNNVVKKPWIGIFKSIKNNNIQKSYKVIDTYVCVNAGNKNNDRRAHISTIGNGYNEGKMKYATEEEIKDFYEILNRDGYDWDPTKLELSKK